MAVYNVAVQIWADQQWEYVQKNHYQVEKNYIMPEKTYSC
jgi:hypothetical protein